MRMSPAIFIMSMSKPPPHFEVKKLLRRLLISEQAEALEESFAQFEFDMDLDMISEQAEALLDSTPEILGKNTCNI
jgi:hypothetical protein